jgi:hypothetical protein
MKKILFLFSILLSANMIFAQSIGLKIGDVDITGLNPNDTVEIPIILTEITNGPLNEIWGWGFYFEADEAYLDWLGTPNAPAGGVSFYNPALPWSLGTFQMAQANNEMAWLGGDGGSAFEVGTMTLPITLATFRFKLVAVPPVLPHPIGWVGLADDANAGKDLGGWLKVGITEVYYNYYFENFPVSVWEDGSLFSGGVVPTPTDWTGAIDEDWGKPGNWTFGVPTGDPEQVVTINATGKAAPVIYGIVVAGTLNLVAGQLSIAPGGGLTTNGVFTNNGVLYMYNNDGTPGGEGKSGSYVNMLPNAGTGSFLYDRDVFCSGQAWNSNDPFGWHYISSPIAGFTTDNIPDYFVNAWNEPATGVDPDFPWVHYGYDPYVNPCLAWPTTPMLPLDAWSVNFDPAYPYPAICSGLPAGPGSVVPFTGPFTALNDGPYSAPATAAGGHAYAGWNFYGNPYAASLDPSLFTWAGFDNGTWGVAMWSEDCTAGNYIYSGLGNGYANFVGPTQGFFLLTTGATSFALTGAERVPTSAPSIYKDEVTNLVTLEASRDEISDVTYIRFMDDMEAGKDVADFPKLFSTAEGLAQIYTTALGEQLAINALPETPVVPMGFTSVTSGEYTISAIETSDFANVVLEDRFTGEQTDLLASSYTFTYTVNDDPDRFFVHFTPLGAPELSAASIQIWSNDHKIYVQAPEINGDIVVFNMMGQEVIRTEIEPGLNILPVSDVNTYYVVKVVSSDVARTGKVYVK